MCAISYAPLQSIGAVSCAFCRASVLRPLARFRSPRFPRIFRLRRDGVTTAGHRDHRDRRDRDARCGTPSLAPTCTRGMRVSSRPTPCCVAIRGLRGPLGGGSTLPRCAGNENKTPNQKHRRGRFPAHHGAQRDRPGRQTHVTRGAKFPGAPSDHKHPCEASAFTYRAAPITTR